MTMGARGGWRIGKVFSLEVGSRRGRGSAVRERRTSRRTTTRRWSLLVALSLATACLSAAAGTPSMAAAGGAAWAAQPVCGAPVADAEFAEESAVLGEDHACEHLESRMETGSSHGTQSGSAEQLSTVAAVSADPAVSGSWSTPFRPSTRAIGITSVLLHTGKVLLFGVTQAGSINTAAYLFDPVTLTGRDVPPPAPIFCGGVAQISDGRVLSAGGANPIPRGIVDVYLFDAVTERWVRQPNSPLGRYYPTTTRLPDGRVLIAGLAHSWTAVHGTRRSRSLRRRSPGVRRGRCPWSARTTRQLLPEALGHAGRQTPPDHDGADVQLQPSHEHVDDPPSHAGHQRGLRRAHGRRSADWVERGHGRRRAGKRQWAECRAEIQLRHQRVDTNGQHADDAGSYER